MPTSSKSLHAGHILIFFLVLGFSLTNCSEPLPDEQQIENAIQQIAEAVEQLDSNELEELLASNIDIDNKGRSLDVEQLRKIMTLYRFKKQTISVNIISTDINMHNHNTHLANADITALVTGSRGLLPDDGKLYQIKSQWRLYDDQWKLQQASWH